MKQSHKTFSIIIFAVINFSFIALNNFKPAPNNFENTNLNINNILAVDSKRLLANNISTWFRNNGSFNRDPFTGNSGFEWPKNSFKTARYVSGLWIGCMVGSDTLTAIAEYGYDYLPGYVDNAGNPQGQDDPLYRIYSIDRGDTTSLDYQNWPVNQGGYINSNGTPFFLGTQTMFYVYTDAYGHTSGQTSVGTLKAQILQTNWCYTNMGYKDVAFTEFRVINRSTSTWTNVYLSVWTDDDLGEATDDRIGCDSIKGLGFTYNASNYDNLYGANPPAVGTLVLKTPFLYTGNNDDTVKYYNPPGSQNLIVKVGYKFTGLNVFNTYNNTSPMPADPRNNTETYRVISGFWRTGQPWTNPINGLVTKVVFSGDPVTATGWNMNDASDRRFLQSFGPINMNPNDTQSIIVAQLIARGENNINSITKLRRLSTDVRIIYDQNFQNVLSIKTISSEIPSGFELKQNYPNPFNPKTKINYSIPNAQYIILKIYDLLGNEIKSLVNEKQNAGKYEVEFNGENLSSGIYYYKIETNNFTNTKKMLLIK